MFIKSRKPRMALEDIRNQALSTHVIKTQSCFRMGICKMRVWADKWAAMRKAKEELAKKRVEAEKKRAEMDKRRAAKEARLAEENKRKEEEVSNCELYLRTLFVSVSSFKCSNNITIIATHF